MMPRLQILIVTHGIEGIRRIASLPHPSHDGVEYIVSWQEADCTLVPAELKMRSDFKIYATATKGISNNRNAAFSHATAPWVMLSDDDLEYTDSHLQNIIDGISLYPDASILTFQYESVDFPKDFPKEGFALEGKHPKGYYITSFEIVLNRKKILDCDKDNALTFNSNFGIGSGLFTSGEEDIFIKRLQRRGHKGRYIPLPSSIHAGSTTSMRIGSSERYIITKGACMLYVKPKTWFLRMLKHAMKASKEVPGKRIGFWKYCRLWLTGVKIAGLKRVFAER